jgi:hypothetical protein
MDQDPEGVFIRKYVPELRGVPTNFIHEPWKMPPHVQKKYNVRLWDSSKVRGVCALVVVFPLLTTAPPARSGFLPRQNAALVRGVHFSPSLAPSLSLAPPSLLS